MPPSDETHGADADLSGLEPALEAVLAPAMRRGDVPGAVAVAGDARWACAPVAVGVRRLGGPATTPDTHYDLASLSKVVATLPALLALASDGRLDLDAPLRTYLPNAGWMRRPSLGDRTARDLLRHTAGLPAWAPFIGIAAERRTVVGYALSSEAQETGVVYSDLGFIVAGALVERLAGVRLDAFVREAVTRPLGLADDALGYRPRGGTGAYPGAPDGPVAASEDCAWRQRVLAGEVHDEAAWIMDGVAGHAGLFGTAEALARYAQAWLRGDAPWAGAALLEEATRRQSPPGSPARGLGWRLAPDGDEGDASEPDAWRPARGFGHTGFTGTSLWIDPEGGRFCVLLTNAVHPSRHDRGGLPALRRSVHDVVFGGR